VAGEMGTMGRKRKTLGRSADKNVVGIQVIGSDLPYRDDSCDDGCHGVNLNMVVLRHRRAVAAAAVVAFNILMFVLVATGPIPMETPFVVA
jgi:hypothetical protein